MGQKTAIPSDLTEGPCDTGCPVARAARILDGKWTSRIIRDLLGGRRRYSQLLQSLDGISPKMLAARLRMLEENRLITRTVYPVVPPHTEYELTAIGIELREVIEAMARFGALLEPNAPVSGD